MSEITKFRMVLPLGRVEKSRIMERNIGVFRVPVVAQWAKNLT